jgi:hypothetical protein
MMSVASSTTPGIGENSWSTPSIFTAVIAAPSIEDSSTRRSAFADRRAEAALERLRVEPTEPIGERFALELEPLGTLKTFQSIRGSFR